jgi:4-hydroxy-tetrahydrodipicolinate synthase
MVSLCTHERFVEARPIHEKMLPIIHSMFAEGSPSGVKYYLNKLGVINETFRLPVVGVSDKHKEKIDVLMKSI